ncbi:MAG: tyrosine-protein phosphatase, partial [Phycisphaerales bacterium]|nr:tyrosine-protein phosphatase [Phycisphaerales bacterium]
DGLAHFAPVAPGALYRCGQPTPDQLDGLISEHGLKTVIALRGSRDEADPDAWERDERAVCERHGVRFLTLPCNHRNPPTADQVRHFLEVVGDPAARPALVHCRIGQQRTGMFCALYRVHIEGVPVDQAVREMDELGFNVRHRRHQVLFEAFREFADRRFTPKGAGAVVGEP